MRPSVDLDLRGVRSADSPDAHHFDLNAILELPGEIVTN
jgi:hypothetical protein